MSIYDNLNEPQREAVFHTDGPLLILAGAAVVLAFLSPVVYEAFVERLNVTCKQEKFDALVDFAFNLGCDALEGSTLLKKIRACRPDAEVRAEFMRWVYSGKTKLPGLVTRRQWEADRYFNKV